MKLRRLKIADLADILADVPTEKVEMEIQKLQAMVDQRKQETRKVAMPKPLSEPDFRPVIELCQGYINALATAGHADEDYDSWMFETAMNAVFGPKVWKWTNPILGGEREKEYANNND